MADFIFPKLSFSEKGPCSPLMTDEETLANAKKSLSSLHTFTLSYLKSQTSPTVGFSEDCAVEILQSDQARIAPMVADATHRQLDLHEQFDSDEDEDLPLSVSSSNTSSPRTTSPRSNHANPSPPPTPLNFHSDLDISTTEPFPDYYESCELNPTWVDKDIEESYRKAISKVFEVSQRVTELDTSVASVSPLTQITFPFKSDKHHSQAKSGTPHKLQSALAGKTGSRNRATSMSTSASEVASAIPVCAESDKATPMTLTSQAKASFESISAQTNQAASIAPFMSSDVSIRSVTSNVTPLPTFTPQSVSSENAGVQTRHSSISSSSTSSNSSREPIRSATQAPSVSRLISQAFGFGSRENQNYRDHRSDFLATRPSLLGGLSSADVQTPFASLSGSLPLARRICSSSAQGTILSIDEIVTPDEPRTPNFQSPIGTGRHVPGRPAPNPNIQRRIREENERKLNILEEIKIILRADRMKDDVLRRFTTMTNIVLRMEWILFRRDVTGDGIRTQEFLSPRVVNEMEELAIPMVQYLAWLDKKLQNERSTAGHVLQTVIEIAKDQDLDVYQRFRLTAQVIIGTLRKPRPLEKHLLAVFQDLYDAYVYSNFLSIRNRQILQENRPNITRANLTRLLIAGWDVLVRSIENYNETITINNDLKNRFVEPVMQRLPNSHDIWEEEWKKNQEQWELEREMELKRLLAEAEDMGNTEAQRQETVQAETRAMADFRTQPRVHRQGI